MTARSLVVTWIVLMALTALAGIAAQVTGEVRLGTLSLIALPAIVLAKARLVMSGYLRLGLAPDFLNGFTFAIAFVLAIVVATILVPF